MGKAITPDNGAAIDMPATRSWNLKSIVTDVIGAIAAGRDANLDYRRQLAHGVDHTEAVKSILRH